MRPITELASARAARAEQAVHDMQDPSPSPADSPPLCVEVTLAEILAVAEDAERRWYLLNDLSTRVPTSHSLEGRAGLLLETATQLRALAAWLRQDRRWDGANDGSP